MLEPGGSRVALMREAKERLYRHGADGISHATFSFATANPEVEIDESFDPGRLATLDLGAIVGGYCSDNRRYAYCGELPAALQSRYETMVEIVDGVGAALKPGTPYAELQQLGVDLFERHRIELLKRFTHVGHNIGLETEEEWIDDRPDRVIKAGMVINIELYSHAETGEQIGNEETYVVEEDGPRRLSVFTAGDPVDHLSAPVNIGLIGLGQISVAHVEGYRRSPHVEHHRGLRRRSRACAGERHRARGQGLLRLPRVACGVRDRRRRRNPPAQPSPRRGG